VFDFFDFCFILIFFAIYSFSVFAETVISGSIFGDVVWVKDSGGYIVDGVCIQDSKSTLKISPGVSVRFNTGSVLILNGLVCFNQKVVEQPKHNNT
jgi:hypothetical protein